MGPQLAATQQQRSFGTAVDPEVEAERKRRARVERLHNAFETACLAAIVVGVFLLAGAGWCCVTAGVAGLVFLELDEILVMIASPRPKK